MFTTSSKKSIRKLGLLMWVFALN